MTTISDLDTALRLYATDREWASYEAYCRLGTYTAAGKALGISKGAVCNNIKHIKDKALRRGYVPEGFEIARASATQDANGVVVRSSIQVKPEPAEYAPIILPDPKKIAQVSTHYKDGRVTEQWIKEKPEDKEREALWRTFAEELARGVERAPLIEAPSPSANGDLVAVYPIGDHHHGMLAWGPETRSDNYDMQISEALLRGAAQHLMALTPPTGTCLIPVLGDFMHYDSFKAVTPTSGNLLDADSRYPKMVRGSVRLLRHMIEAALERHASVHVIPEIGNHDMASMIFMQELLANVYENEPRVTVDRSPSRFHYFEFGKVLIGTHHGDGAKPDKLPAIMATDMPEAWGRTRYRYWLTGHVHHDQRRDYVGASVESFRILAPVDAWAAMKGYRSAQDMRAIVYHREYGECERRIVNPAMIHAMTGPPEWHAPALI